MLELTPDAVSHLRRIRKERGLEESVGVRLVNKGSSVGLTFASSPARDDVVLETLGMVVSVPQDVATALEQAVVDAKAENGTTHLVLRRRKTSARPS